MCDLLAKVLAEPEKYQGIIAGTIAFVGVIVALCGNAVLQWSDRWSKRCHDRRVMRSALLAELGFLRDSYEGRVQMMKEKPAASFDIPIATETEVYDKLLGQIGVLRPDQGSKVIHAYLAAKHLSMDVGWNVKAGTGQRIPIDEAQLSERLQDGMMRVPPWVLPAAVRLHEERIDVFKKAIASLK